MTEATEEQKKPTVVVICGSTRFWEAMQEANLQETAAGRIVLAPGLNMKRPHSLWATEEAADALKVRLDQLHFAKIAMSSEVLVVTDESGYVGESTIREIAYAQELGLPIRYWAAPGPGTVEGSATGADN